MQKLLVLASVMWLGCSGDNAQQSVSVGNINPTGTVGGLVIDAVTEMPLMGATVRLVAGGMAYTAMTDAEGLFSITGVPSGAFIATVSNTGFQSALINSALGGAVGNFPVKDPIATLGPVGLIKNDGTFAVKLIDQAGAPVPNVTVTVQVNIRWVSFSNGQPQPVGSYEITGMSGMDGVVTLMGLPNFSYLGPLGVDTIAIHVPPVLVMGSTTVYSFLGGTFNFSVAQLANSGVIDQPIIRLAGPETALSILSSNLEVLQGLTSNNSSTVAPSFTQIATYPYIAANGPINIEFNQSINRSTIRAKLFEEDGTPSQTLLMATGSANTLTITPMAALTTGRRYNLSLHVDAATAAGEPSAQREMNTTVPLFVAPATGAALNILTTTIKSLPGASPQPFTFQFSEPVGAGFATASVSCVVFYDNATANLDNDTNVLHPGEYDKTKVTQLFCPNPVLDITRMTSLEPAGFPVTGFSSKWQITYDDAGQGGCKAGVTKGAGCSPPATGTQIYLKPSRATTTGGVPLAFKRPDGTTIADNDTNLSFPIPPP
jgi:hypothetical protein